MERARRESQIHRCGGLEVAKREEKRKKEARSFASDYRMAPSYSLGYNSAVLRQCKLNESHPRFFSSRLSLSTGFVAIFVRPPCPSFRLPCERLCRSHRFPVPVGFPCTSRGSCSTPTGITPPPPPPRPLCRLGAVA